LPNDFLRSFSLACAAGFWEASRTLPIR